MDWKECHDADGNPLLGPVLDQLLWATPMFEEPVVEEDVTFIGQAETLDRINSFAGTHLPHTLILGEPGIGKTQLARFIASERKEQFTEHLCPVTESDLIPGINFLDECHLQKHPETLFAAMAGRAISIIAATTKPEALDRAWRTRFPLVVRLRRYTEPEMVEMYLHFGGEPEGAYLYAKASGGNPRQLERLIETAEGIGTYDPENVLSVARITADGLTDEHLALLVTMAKVDRPIGLTPLAHMNDTDPDSVRFAERYLLDRDLIRLTQRGRELTNLGRRVATAWKDFT